MKVNKLSIQPNFQIRLFPAEILEVSYHNLLVVYVIDIARDRVFYGMSTRAKPRGRVAMHVYCHKNEDFSCYNYACVLYHDDPLLLCNNLII